MTEKAVSRRSKILTRIPPPRVKRILQTDEEIGKMANPVPAVIARSLEVFIEKLLTKSVEITQQRLAKTLSPQHMKECVKLEPTFRFLHGVVSAIPDLGSEAGSSGGHSTVTSGHHGSVDGYFPEMRKSSTTFRSFEPKRRGSKHNSAGDSQTGPSAAKLPSFRRGKANKRSVEVYRESGDLSDADDLSGDYADTTPQVKAVRKTSIRREQKQEQGEFYELGPSISDDVPDDPAAS